MATLADLEKAIDALLNHSLGKGNFTLTSRTAPKAYEAYIFGLGLRAARELRPKALTVTLEGISGPPSPFIFRGGPGSIGSTRRNYGYAHFLCNGQRLEFHAGVEFHGTSGMRHEIDVSLMRTDEADKCRVKPARAPNSAALVGAWECKFYDTVLSKSQARSFVGLMDDMGANPRLSGLCSNRDHDEVRKYLRLQRRPDPHLGLTPLVPRQEDVFIGGLKSALNKLCGK